MKTKQIKLLKPFQFPHICVIFPYIVPLTVLIHLASVAHLYVCENLFVCARTCALCVCVCMCVCLCVYQQCAISAPCSKTKGNKETGERETHRRGKIGRERGREQEDRFHYLQHTEELNHTHTTERSYSQRLDPVRRGICNIQTVLHALEIYTARTRNA